MKAKLYQSLIHTWHRLYSKVKLLLFGITIESWWQGTNKSSHTYKRHPPPLNSFLNMIWLTTMINNTQAIQQSDMVGGWRHSMDHSAGTGNIKYWCGTVCGNQKLAISTQPIWHSLVIALTRVALSLAWNTGTKRATGHATSLEQERKHGNRWWDKTRAGSDW